MHHLNIAMWWISLLQYVSICIFDFHVSSLNMPEITSSSYDVNFHMHPWSKELSGLHDEMHIFCYICALTRDIAKKRYRADEHEQKPVFVLTIRDYVFLIKCDITLLAILAVCYLFLQRLNSTQHGGYCAQIYNKPHCKKNASHKNKHHVKKIGCRTYKCKDQRVDDVVDAWTESEKRFRAKQGVIIRQE